MSVKEERVYILRVWSIDFGIEPEPATEYGFDTKADAETAQRLLQDVTGGADPDPMYFSELEDRP